MKHKIALLSDIHGNITALEAVIADATKENVTEYWCLGDVLMPGPGAADLLALLKAVPVTAFVKGNWDDCLLDILDNEAIDLDNPSHIYIARLAQYVCQNMTDNDIAFIRALPLHLTKTINSLTFGISHHLPDKNWGGDLWKNQDQKSFDRLFIDDQHDIAICGHTHHQMMLYSSDDRIIINPGAIERGHATWRKLRDSRAQYAMIEIDEQGAFDVQFRKVVYDSKKELERAVEKDIPYLNLYKEFLETGKKHTHNKELLDRINREHSYKEEVVAFFSDQYWNV